MTVLRFLAGRVAGAVVLLLVVSVLLFAAVELLPGDVATQILGANATPDRVATLRGELSLDEPAHVRYGRWLGGVLRGDLGQAATTDRSVAATIGDRLANTAVLAGLAIVAIAVVAVGAGVVTGRRDGGPVDVSVSMTTLIAVSLPEFVVAGLLVAGVAFGLGWFPAVSLIPADGTALDRPEILVLPVVSLAIVGGAFGARLIRAVVADASRLPHVEAARLAGLPERRVLWRHLLPSAAGPIAQVLAFMVPYLIGGTVVVERVFSYPGLGTLLVEQVRQRDAPVVEAIGLLLAFAVVVGFLLADLVGVLASPAQRTQERGGVWSLRILNIRR